MSGYLVDTNVISEFIKPEPDRQVVEWFGEILLGIERMPLGRRRASLQQWFDEGLPEWFQTHLLAITKSTMDRWAQLTIGARSRGITVATTDGLIAAAALEHNLTVITRDRDFDGSGINLFNPCQMRPPDCEGVLLRDLLRIRRVSEARSANLILRGKCRGIRAAAKRHDQVYRRRHAALQEQHGLR